MKTIPLTQGQVALVDDDDFERLSMFSWHAAWNPSTQSFYAKRTTPHENGKQRTIRMHRAIVNASEGSTVDHKNHNTLDCQKSNLRVCTTADNVRNRKGANKNSKSGSRGVFWHKENRKWHAQINAGRKIHLGFFNEKSEAEAAYAEANIKHFGDFGGVTCGNI